MNLHASWNQCGTLISLEFASKRLKAYFAYVVKTNLAKIILNHIDLTLPHDKKATWLTQVRESANYLYNLKHCAEAQADLGQQVVFSQNADLNKHMPNLKTGYLGHKYQSDVKIFLIEYFGYITTYLFGFKKILLVRRFWLWETVYHYRSNNWLKGGTGPGKAPW